MTINFSVSLSKKSEHHKRTKHVGIWYHRIRQENESGDKSIEHVPLNFNEADILTKIVSITTLSGHVDKFFGGGNEHLHKVRGSFEIVKHFVQTSITHVTIDVPTTSILCYISML